MNLESKDSESYSFIVRTRGRSGVHPSVRAALLTFSGDRIHLDIIELPLVNVLSSILPVHHDFSTKHSVCTQAILPFVFAC